MSTNGRREGVFSAGRVRRAPLLPAPVFASDSNSYCLYCGQWYFGEALSWCPRCDGAIFRRVLNEELRLFASRSSLHGF